MTKIPRFVQWGIGGMAIFAVTAITTLTVLRFRPLPWATTAGERQEKTTCKTIVRDPKPPINIRSSPIVAPDNVVNTLPNGSQVVVVDEKVFNGGEGWLRISAPYAGWVSKKLTVTSCVSGSTAQPPPASDSGAEILAKAMEQYHLGQLEGAIALAQTIPTNSLTHEAAQASILRWQTDWQTAEASFNQAQAALAQGQWQEVVVRVQNFPDNRFWRDKLTPLVRQAMDQQRKVQKSPGKS